MMMCVIHAFVTKLISSYSFSRWKLLVKKVSRRICLVKRKVAPTDVTSLSRVPAVLILAYSRYVRKSPFRTAPLLRIMDFNNILFKSDRRVQFSVWLCVAESN